jgi:hypothetical protein
MSERFHSMHRVFIVTILWICIHSMDSVAQQVPKKTFQATTFDVGYLEYLPADYHTNTDKKYPLLIFLHGGGQSGNGTPESLERVKDWGPPRLIHEGHNMCFTVNGVKECFIVLSPQLAANNAYNWAFVVSLLFEHIEIGPDNYRVDPDRIYLTGLSRGGMGVYQFAGSPLNVPNRLAAIAPIAAWSENGTEGCIISGRKIPLWAFHGLEDTVVPYAMGSQAFHSVSDCADPAPEAEMIFTTYKDDGKYHDSWLPAYDTGNTYHSPNLYQWFLLQSKAANPGDVTAIGESSKVFPDHQFSVSPNPARDQVALTFGSDRYQNFFIAIVDLNGKNLIEINASDKPIDISALPNGAYIMEARSIRGHVIRERLIVLK